MHFLIEQAITSGFAIVGGACSELAPYLEWRAGMTLRKAKALNVMAQHADAAEHRRDILEEVQNISGDALQLMKGSHFAGWVGFVCFAVIIWRCYYS